MPDRHLEPPPVAMFRGTVPSWHLYDGSPGERLAYFSGGYNDARRAANEWCEERGYYLSAWSDADDRVPRSACICDPAMGDVFTAGCPMHRPAATRTGDGDA